MYLSFAIIIPLITSNTVAFHQALAKPGSSRSVVASKLFQAYLDNEYGERVSVDSPTTATFKADYKKLGLSHPAIFPFGKGRSGPGMENKFILGGKGANLAEMSSIGLSVPPGFTITTECCKYFCEDWNGKIPDELWKEILASLKPVENELRCYFGDTKSPLLLSVRSGAAVSMPGMMDTVLNLGLNDRVCEGLGVKTGKPRFAWDSYRRFIEMFGSVVLEIPRGLFEEVFHDIKSSNGYVEDSEMTAEDLKLVVHRFKKVYETSGHVFPEDVYEQLRLAIQAVFRGWMGPRAVKYREVEKIRDALGTAVNVQAMVFGNMGTTSGTGVCFTRNPNTGEKKLFGEYLTNAQGEDVVAGIRTPLPIQNLEVDMPQVYSEFVSNANILEKHYGDMQDIEFTIQEGKLYMLQTRNGKRGGLAAINIAVDLVNEKMATKEEAIMKVRPEHLDQLLHPGFPDVSNKSYKSAVVAKGLPASPGAAVGRIAFTNERVVDNKHLSIPSILVREDTSPEDIEGMWSSQGILTARGGMTSHAAVVARGWGRPCVCGCPSIKVDEDECTLTITKADGPKIVLNEGDYISLNGNTGEVLTGAQEVSAPKITGNLKTLMKWVDDIMPIKVLANADTPSDAIEAREKGATGIGLCRTEHMFFHPDRINKVRQMILGNAEQAEDALKNMIKFQQHDFEGIFKAMDGYPVTIRLLDPPLHEFLPHVDDDDVLSTLSSQLGITKEELVAKVHDTAELNPMLGLRGCRLGITRPEITEMQVRAILEAALNVGETGVDARPEIMIPFVGKVEEFTNQADLVRKVADQVFKERNRMCNYQVGTMIEIPRAALVAHQIAKEADFFSFGSNDLTQMTFGYSRDDAGTFLPSYLSKGILMDDPFVTIDQEGVGQLIKMTVNKGREVKPGMKIGVCGEHGGDPRSIQFFTNEAGLSYVSCSPFRVPIARLAAAQAAVEGRKKPTSA